MPTGLNLIDRVEYADSGQIVTRAALGSTGARLWRLEARGSRRTEQREESHSEQVIGEYRLTSYEVSLLGAGVYKVESGTSGLVYFQISDEGAVEIVRERTAWKRVQG